MVLNIVYDDKIVLVIIISVYTSKFRRYRTDKEAKIATLVKKMAKLAPFRCL